MNEFLEQIKVILLEYSVQMLVLGLLTLTSFAFAQLKKLVAENIENEAVKQAVRYTEQVYKGVSSSKKYETALIAVCERLQKYNINIDAERLKIKIEAAVNEFFAHAATEPEINNALKEEIPTEQKTPTEPTEQGNPTEPTEPTGTQKDTVSALATLKPVKQNVKADQIRTKQSNIRLRVAPGLTSEILGFAEIGYYDFYEKSESDGYTWYRIGKNIWIAHSSEWSEVITANSYFVYPVKYIAITQYFHSAHRGFDFGWNYSHFGPNQAVYAATSGVVVKAWWFAQAGNTLRIRYDDEVNKISWYTQYKHLSSFKVKAGDSIQKGQIIGLMGTTGSSSTGNHLHFDLIKAPLNHNYTQMPAEQASYSVVPSDYLYANDDYFFSSDAECVKKVKRL